MRAVIWIVLIVVWFGIPALIIYSSEKKRRGIAADTRASRNHLNLARWVERMLNDDMVRVTIPSGEQSEANALLDEFYGKDNNINNRKGSN